MTTKTNVLKTLSSDASTKQESTVTKYQANLAIHGKDFHSSTSRAYPSTDSFKFVSEIERMFYSLNILETIKKPQFKGPNDLISPLINSGKSTIMRDENRKTDSSQFDKVFEQFHHFSSPSFKTTPAEPLSNKARDDSDSQLEKIFEALPIKDAYKNAMIKALKNKKSEGPPRFPGGFKGDVTEWLSNDNDEEREEFFFTYFMNIDWRAAGKNYNVCPPPCAGFTLEKKVVSRESKYRPGRIIKFHIDLHDKYDLPPSLNYKAFDKAIKYAHLAGLVKADEDFFN